MKITITILASLATYVLSQPIEITKREDIVDDLLKPVTELIGDLPIRSVVKPATGLTGNLPNAAEVLTGGIIRDPSTGGLTKGFNSNISPVGGFADIVNGVLDTATRSTGRLHAGSSVDGVVNTVGKLTGKPVGILGGSFSGLIGADPSLGVLGKRASSGSPYLEGVASDSANAVIKYSPGTAKNVIAIGDHDGPKDVVDNPPAEKEKLLIAFKILTDTYSSTLPESDKIELNKLIKKVIEMINDIPDYGLETGQLKELAGSSGSSLGGLTDELTGSGSSPVVELPLAGGSSPVGELLGKRRLNQMDDDPFYPQEPSKVIPKPQPEKDSGKSLYLKFLELAKLITEESLTGVQRLELIKLIV